MDSRPGGPHAAAAGTREPIGTRGRPGTGGARKPEHGASTVGVVVLCGGTSRRFGGGDKTSAPLGDSTVLGVLVTALPQEWPLVCVGEPRPLPRPTRWAREHPVGSGPVAGLAAGLSALPPRITTVLALAGDQPFSGNDAPELVAALSDAPADVDGVAARQPDGRPQLLLAAYRRDRLAPLLDGDAVDAGVYRRLSSLHVTTLTLGDHATLDVDTRADLDRARRAR